VVPAGPDDGRKLQVVVAEGKRGFEVQRLVPVGIGGLPDNPAGEPEDRHVDEPVDNPAEEQGHNLVGDPTDGSALGSEIVGVQEDRLVVLELDTIVDTTVLGGAGLELHLESHTAA
jgi:hypothetical protein